MKSGARWRISVRRRYSPDSPSINRNEFYDEIILAVTTLASNQTGALIVIERDIGLKTYIESGIALDAALSYDLLVTIFNPSVPLHDGAVIVQNGRIAAAACFLPLTVKPRLSKELGTRHRAAIGVTEETDAVAIIVSEETGAISFAHDGEMERYLDPDTLATPAARCVRAQGRLDARRMSSPQPAEHRVDLMTCNLQSTGSLTTGFSRSSRWFLQRCCGWRSPMKRRPKSDSKFRSNIATFRRSWKSPAT